MAFVALLDACVLYPAPLRDLLIRLGRTGLYRARWSDDIHEEWIRNVSIARPEIAGKLATTRQRMDNAIEDALVTGYHDLIDGLSLPDPGDRHVLAAAIAGRADVIVTFNLKDFPAASLKRYGIEALHPDLFVRHNFDLDPAMALAAVRDQRASLRNPPQAVDTFLDTLNRQGLPETVAYLRPWAEFL